MSKSAAIVKWGVFSVAGLVVVVAAAWALARAVYPTADQREAIAEMEQSPEFAGSNAFALMWTLGRDVPDDELEAVMAEDVRRFSQRSRDPDPQEIGNVSFETAASAYPDLAPSGDDRALFCRSSDEDCLARIRRDLDAYSALIDRNRAVLDQIDGFHEYHYLQSEFPYHTNAPMPRYQYLFLPRTRHEVAFVQGRTRQAIAGTCRDIATWRRLGAHSDHLIVRLIGAVVATNHGGYSLASMLAEQPLETPLPEPCEEALAPPAIDEASLCTAMRGEFSTAAAGLRHMMQHPDQAGLFDRWLSPLLYDAEATLGREAAYLQSYCQASERERLRADSREAPQRDDRGVLRFACMGNPAGCVLESIGAGFSSYRHSLQDYAARLRVLATLAWMRRHAGDGRTNAELLADRPAELRSPARDIEFGPDGTTLRVPLYVTSEAEYWSIPLPAELHASG